jgi:bacterioferritin-associated ferredoxin
MLVCHCHRVSDQEIRACARQRGSLYGVCERLGAGTACGGCMPLVQALVAEEVSQPEDPLLVLRPSLAPTG